MLVDSADPSVGVLVMSVSYDGNRRRPGLEEQRVTVRYDDAGLHTAIELLLVSMFECPTEGKLITHGGKSFVLNQELCGDAAIALLRSVMKLERDGKRVRPRYQ